MRLPRDRHYQRSQGCSLESFVEFLCSTGSISLMQKSTYYACGGHGSRLRIVELGWITGLAICDKDEDFRQLSIELVALGFFGRGAGAAGCYSMVSNICDAIDAISWNTDLG